LRQNRPVIAAEQTRRFAGGVGADFRCVRNVWMKISGECPVTALHGNARTVIGKTDSAISSDSNLSDSISEFRQSDILFAEYIGPFLIFIANLLFFA
jgi:hypothetical protein